MIYFKDENNGVGITSDNKLCEGFVEITKEEFEEIVAQHEAEAAAEEVE